MQITCFAFVCQIVLPKWAAEEEVNHAVHFIQAGQIVRVQ